MKSTVRQRVLFSLLAVSSALVAWDRLRTNDSGISTAVVRPPSGESRMHEPRTPAGRPPSMPTPITGTAPAKSSTSTPGPDPTDVALLQPRTAYLEPGADAFPPFRPASAIVPVSRPPESEPEPAPVAPVAPPVPFNVIGKKVEGGRWEVYLAKGETTFVATIGAVLAGTYRVEDIQPTELTLLYLPLGEKQTLNSGPRLHD
jgi:hypothetical protein